MHYFDPLTGVNGTPRYYFKSTTDKPGPDQLTFYFHYMYNTFFSKPDNLYAYGDLLFSLDNLPPNLKPALGAYLVKAMHHYISDYNWHLQKLMYENNGLPSTSTVGLNLHPHSDECECGSPECAEHKKSRMSKQEQQNIDEESSIVEIIEEKVLEPKHPYTDPIEPYPDPEVFSSIKENFTEEITTIDVHLDQTLYIQQNSNCNLMDRATDQSTPALVTERKASPTLIDVPAVSVEPSPSTPALVPERKASPTLIDAPAVSVEPSPSTPALVPERKASPTLIDVPAVSVEPSPSTPALVPERKASPTLIDVPAVSVEPSPSTPTLPLKDSIFASSEFMSFFSDLKLGSNSKSASPILASLPLPKVSEALKAEAQESRPEPRQQPLVPETPKKTDGAGNGGRYLTRRETLEAARARAATTSAEEERDKVFGQFHLSPRSASSPRIPFQFDTFNWSGEVVKKQQERATTDFDTVDDLLGDISDNEIFAVELEKMKASSAALLDPASLNPQVTCIFCPSMQHITTKCRVYQKKEDRLYRLMELKRCFLCLSMDHSKATCPQKDSIECIRCYLPHLEMLYHDV